MIRKYVFLNLSLMLSFMVCGQAIQTGSFTDKGYEFDIRNFHIIIEKNVTDFFNKDLDSTENFYHQIGQTIVQAVLDSFDDYSKADLKNKSGFKVPDIKAAIDEYKNGILDGTRDLTIAFEFGGRNLKYYEKKRNNNPESSDGKKYLKLQDLLSYGFRGGASPIIEDNPYYTKEKIIIRNCYTDFFMKRAIGERAWGKKHRVNCRFWRWYDYLDKKGRVLKKVKRPRYKWTYATDKKILFKSCVFHELVHLAFNSEKYPNVKARELDEATIEDVTLNVFPREMGGGNFYEYLYSFGVWWYFHKNFHWWHGTSNPNEYFKHLRCELNKIKINEKDLIRIERHVNPPYELKYHKIKDKIDFVPIPVFNKTDSNEGWVADDCRDEPVKPYALPHWLCSEHKMFFQDVGGLASNNLFENKSVLAQKSATFEPSFNILFDYFFLRTVPNWSQMGLREVR